PWVGGGRGCSGGRMWRRGACRKARPRYSARHRRKGAVAKPLRPGTSAGLHGPGAGARPDCPEPSRIRCSTCSFVLRQVELILPRRGVQTFELQALAGGLAGVAEHPRQTRSEQQTTGIGLRKASKTLVVVARGHVVLSVVGQLRHGQQGQRAIGVQAQGALEVLHGLFLALERLGGQPVVFEHPRAFAVEAVLAGLAVTLIGLFVTLLLVEEGAVVDEDARIPG